MKNKKINIFILMLALALVLYFTLKNNFSDIVHEISNVDILIFILSILVFVLSLFFKSISLHCFIKEKKKNYPFKKIFELTLIGQFLNGITPFQSGGQPFQIYLLKKDGIRISDSTSAMIKDFISYQIALILMGIFAILANSWLELIPNKRYLTWLIFLGFIINVIVLIFLMFITNAKKSSLKIINKILDLVLKFRIFKKININKQKVINGVERFYESGMDLKKRKKKLIIPVITNVINLSLLYIIPFIIFKSLGSSNVTILSSIIVTAFVMLIGNFIPIPGATGGIEYGFISFFSGFNISFTILSSAMLLWRFVTYFFGMLIGFIALVLKEGIDKKCE